MRCRWGRLDEEDFSYNWIPRPGIIHQRPPQRQKSSIIGIHCRRCPRIRGPNSNIFLHEIEYREENRIKNRLNVATSRFQDSVIILETKIYSWNCPLSHKLQEFIAECPADYFEKGDAAMFSAIEDNNNRKIIERPKPKLAYNTLNWTKRLRSLSHDRFTKKAFQEFKIKITDGKTIT